jgi:hypothetical protein
MHEVEQSAGHDAEQLVSALHAAHSRLALEPAAETGKETAGVR